MGDVTIDRNPAVGLAPATAVINGPRNGRVLRLIRRAYPWLAVAVALLTDVLLINMAFALAY